MATLDEIERSWGYYDDPEDDDDEIDPDYWEQEEDDAIYMLSDDEIDEAYTYTTRHVCTIYSVCDACGKLEYATGIRWWNRPEFLCQCLPF